MKTFTISPHIEIVCEWKKTRMAFKHEATLLIDGEEVDKVKICYQNRTWERFEFDSVIEKLLEKNKDRVDKGKALATILAVNEGAPSPFKGIAAIAMMGEFFGKTKEEKNSWKKRMLKAGLEDKGLSFPEDWDSLPEDVKEARLNGAIGQIA
jgi:hypothetical protein